MPATGRRWSRRQSERHGAAICAELHAGLLRERCADLAARCRRRTGARAPSRTSSCRACPSIWAATSASAFEIAQRPLATPARQRARRSRTGLLQAASAFEADPAVKGLRERFGAEVDAGLGKAGELTFQEIAHDERRTRQSDAPSPADAGDHAEGSGGAGGPRSDGGVGCRHGENRDERAP